MLKAAIGLSRQRYYLKPQKTYDTGYFFHRVAWPCPSGKMKSNEQQRLPGKNPLKMKEITLLHLSSLFNVSVISKHD